MKNNTIFVALLTLSMNPTIFKASPDVQMQLTLMGSVDSHLYSGHNFFTMDNTQEIWKPIKNYEGYYEVSNLGRIRSNERVHTNKMGKRRTVSEKILKSHSCNNKYVDKRLANGVNFVSVRVHRIVAQTFIPNPLNKLEVNHKNGKKCDNRVENLEWATTFENAHHAIDNGLTTVRNGELCTFSKLKESDILDIRSKYPQKTVKELALEYDVHTDNIKCIVSRKTWKHI
jgi:hypothetical protein